MALKITPLFQATIPSHAYPSVGHAAIGFDEHEYRVGVNVGRRLDPILPKVFVQGQYAFGMTPVVAANIAPKRSYGELQLGYLLNRHITFQGWSALTWSHNGIELDYNLFPNNLTEEQYLNHDRIARSNLLGAGGTVSYQLNRSTIFFLSAGHTFYGTRPSALPWAKRAPRNSDTFNNTAEFLDPGFSKRPEEVEDRLLVRVRQVVESLNYLGGFRWRIVVGAWLVFVKV